jgi:hypothetical protein
MQAKRIASLESRLGAEQEKLGRLSATLDTARGRSQASTPGGLTDYDPAILSGTRRRPNHRAEDRRHAAYDREAAAFRAVQDQGRIVEGLERQLQRAKADAKAPRDLASLKPVRVINERSMQTPGLFLGLSGDKSSAGVEWQLPHEPNSVRFLPAEGVSLFSRDRRCPDLLLVQGDEA